MAMAQHMGNQSLDELISSWDGHDWNGQEWEDSLLRDYLLYDCWSPHIALCTLSGFDYQTIDTGDSSTPAQFQFINVLSPIAFMSFINGNRVKEVQLLTSMNLDIDRLRGFWENSGNDKEDQKYPPAFFIKWAVSKRIFPAWLNWTIEKKIYIEKQEVDKALLSDFDKTSFTGQTELAMDLQAGAGGTFAVPDPRPAATWTLNKPRRFQGYTEPLYLLLEAAHFAGNDRPTARDVLQTFAAKLPSQIANVIEGENLDYFLANGKTKTANLKAIRAAITGMTGKS